MKFVKLSLSLYWEDQVSGLSIGLITVEALFDFYLRGIFYLSILGEKILEIGGANVC